MEHSIKIHSILNLHYTVSKKGEILDGVGCKILEKYIEIGHILYVGTMVRVGRLSGKITDVFHNTNTNTTIMSMQVMLKIDVSHIDKACESFIKDGWRYVE